MVYDGTKVLFDKVYQEDWKRLGLEPGLLLTTKQVALPALPNLVPSRGRHQESH